MDRLVRYLLDPATDSLPDADDMGLFPHAQRVRGATYACELYRLADRPRPRYTQNRPALGGNFCRDFMDIGRARSAQPAAGRL